LLTLSLLLAATDLLESDQVGSDRRKKCAGSEKPLPTLMNKGKGVTLVPGTVNLLHQKIKDKDQ
jgi:hypothetical protein